MDVTFESLTPPDIGTDEETLKQMLDTLKVLHQFQVSFDDQKAVCQAQIKTLVEECNVALDDRYPIQSFTVKPSPQNLAVANESVLTATGQALKGLIVRAWELIKKLCRWLVDTFRKLAGMDKSIQQRVYLIKVLAEGNDKLAQEGGVQPGTVGHAAPPPPPTREEATGLSDEDYAKLIKAYQKFNEAVELYGRNISGMGADLLKQGPLMGTFKAVALLIPGYTKSVIDKTVLINQFVIKDQREGVSLHTRVSDLNVDLPIPGGLVRTQHWAPLAHAKTMPEYLGALKAAAYELHGENAVDPMDWFIALRVVMNPRSGFGEPVVPMPEHLWDTVQKLNDIISKFSDDEVLARVDKGIEKAYESMVMTLVKEVKALADYAEAARLLLDVQYSLLTEILRCCAAQYELNVQITGGDHDPHRSETLMDMRIKLREAMQAGSHLPGAHIPV